jgi:hypothetical protein
MYADYIPFVIIVIIVFYFYYVKSKEEGFNLTDMKNELRRSYSLNNPQVQYTVNPVPDMIRTVNGESYYPILPARRPDAIINPINEPLLRNVIINNINNIAKLSTTNSKGERVLNNRPYLGGNNKKIQAYAYPHSDLPTSQTYITGLPLYTVNPATI